MKTLRVLVYHDYYGCDTGCCGHTVELKDGDRYICSQFVFDHPHLSENDMEAVKKYAREVLEDSYKKDHLIDLDWDNCMFQFGDDDDEGGYSKRCLDD